MEMNTIFREIPPQITLGGYILEAVIAINHHATKKEIINKVNMMMLRDAKKQKQALRMKLSGIGATKFMNDNISKQLKVFRKLGLLEYDRGWGVRIAPHLRRILERDFAAEFKAEIEQSSEITEILKNLGADT